jgi:acyl-CoA synthetase (AMP-forming)/AMP-acid ligase II
MDSLVTNTFGVNFNVSRKLSEHASIAPERSAIVIQGPRRRDGKRTYRTMSFRELEEDSSRLASGLLEMGITPGQRVVLLVRPGIDFVSLVFASLKAGLVMVLIDPGMAGKHLVRCLSEAEPEAFIAIPIVQAIRRAMWRRFPKVHSLVTVGRRWFWGGKTIDQVRRLGRSEFAPSQQTADAPAAIIFTSGSTGAPKGVLYSHATFDGQVEQIQNHYQIPPGDVDISGFPLFALFNSAMGVTTVFPEMDFTRPAQIDPQNFLAAAADCNAAQSFGSPALWNTVSRYCEANQLTIPSLKRVFMAGAPASPRVLERVKRTIHSEGEAFTPYGATESLPVASISASEVLRDTAQKTREGKGVCVGSRFGGIDWKVIELTDEPIQSMSEVRELRRGEIGELAVSGAVVTQMYVTTRTANALAKIQDGERVWHRMGDVGYLDAQDRFWFCGRKSQRVVLPRGETMFTEPCESIASEHPQVYRSALVGIAGEGGILPAMVVETWPEVTPASKSAIEQLEREVRDRLDAHPLTASIRCVYWHRSLPVDIRHNAKIFRERLAIWATKQWKRGRNRYE